MRFANPPLVEVVAELRWGPPEVKLDTADMERLFIAFGAQIAALGYTQIERIIPVGFPIPPYKTVYRYRKADSSSLFQVGNGVFAVNITPPYTTWDEFLPIIRNGVAAFLRCRSHDENSRPFTACVLQYINAFDERLTCGSSPLEFYNNALGFTIKLPDAVSSRLRSDAHISPAIQFSIPMDNNITMQLSSSTGVKAQESKEVVLFNIVITNASSIPASLDEAVDALDVSHSVIRETFLSITAPIKNRMV